MKSYMLWGMDGEGNEIVNDYDFSSIKEAKDRAKIIIDTPEYLAAGLYSVRIEEEGTDRECVCELFVKPLKKNQPQELNMKCELENTMAAYSEFKSNGIKPVLVKYPTLSTAILIEQGKINDVPVTVYLSQEIPGDSVKNKKLVDRIDVDKEVCERQGISKDRIISLVEKYEVKNEVEAEENGISV